MHFRRLYAVPNMLVYPGQEIRFDAVGASGATIDLRNLTRDEQPYWSHGPTAHCTCAVERELPKKAKALFESLGAGRIPEGLTADDFFRMQGIRDAMEDPVFTPGRIPEFLEQAMAPVLRELSNAANVVLGLVRWRCNVSGPIAVPALGELEWSLDAAHWRRDPRRSPFHEVGFGPDVVVNDGRRADLEKMIRSGASEPLHQSLLREAESLRNSNPRSALTVGVMAAETAVKSIVGKLAPDASWLVQNLPSPPIVKILEDYVPRLGGEPRPIFPAGLLKELKVAVGLRNELVHGARALLDVRHLEAAFAAIRDVVWLCDYYSGAAWAVNRVRKETLTAIGLSPTVDKSGWFVD